MFSACSFYVCLRFLQIESKHKTRQSQREISFILIYQLQEKNLKETAYLQVKKMSKSVEEKKLTVMIKILL